MKQDDINKDLAISAAMARIAYEALDDKQGEDIS